MRQFVKGGANLLVNISNDGYFGHSTAREQHLEIARMRAVENSRWLIRSTNDGITAVIDPDGRIDERLPLYRELVEHMHFAFRSGTTFYTNYGDWFAWGCLIAALFALDGRNGRTTRRKSGLTVPDHKHVPVLDNVLFAFQAQQAFLAHARIAV